MLGVPRFEVAVANASLWRTNLNSALLPCKCLSALVIVAPAFASQQDVNAREAVAYARRGDLLHPLSHRPIVTRLVQVFSTPKVRVLVLGRRKRGDDERSWERSAAEPFQSCTPTDRSERAVECQS